MPALAAVRNVARGAGSVSAARAARCQRRGRPHPGPPKDGSRSTRSHGSRKGPGGRLAVSPVHFQHGRLAEVDPLENSALSADADDVVVLGGVDAVTSR
jgi:hypothetical protein